MIKSFAYNGRTVSVDLTPLPDGRYRAVIEDREYVFSPKMLPDGGMTFSLGGKRQTVYTAAQAGDTLVALDGAVYTLSPAEMRNRRRGRSASGDLTAQMPGQVRELLAREGDAVHKGQPILLLEAMKMEIKVAAPADGILKRLLVKPGDIVARGQPLAEIE